MRTPLTFALALVALGCGGARTGAAQHNGDQGRNMAELGSVARSREPQLRFCYTEYGRRVNPRLAGKVAIAVTLAPAGHVTAVRVTSRSWSGRGVDRVEKCICDKIRSWKFPEYEGGEGTYPLTFVFTQ